MENLNMDGLEFGNILSPTEIDNLFDDRNESDNTDDTNIPSDTTEEQSSGEENIQEKIKSEDDQTTEVNVDNLFEEPESVGSEEKDVISEEQEDTSPKDDGTSPSFYSSIAKALMEEGIFPDLKDNISKIKTPEDFKNVIDKAVESRLTEKQQRINQALNVDMQPDIVQKYENTIEFLDNISDDSIKAETSEGENLRKQLIYQDYINRGYTRERAEREVSKSLQAGTDIEDAVESLKSTKDFFKESYQKVRDEAEKRDREIVEQRKKDAETLEKSILEGELLGNLDINKSIRRKMMENLSSPSYKDPDTGQYLTPIQKYEKENRLEFLKNLSLIYTLTDGFKNLDGLVKTKVNKEVRKGLRELEHTLNNTARTSDGNIKFVSGVDDDPDSFIGKGFTLDV